MNSIGISGYATTSRRSALVMKLIDSLPSVRKESAPPRIDSSAVISSLAGLGDLIIQLPLIAGLVNKSRSMGAEPLVALRPAHVSIGEACGWQVLPFENPLVDFFGHGLSFRVLRKTIESLQNLRRKRVGTWVDLSGNAFNAAALRIGGVQQLYSAVTRGGNSLINGKIPQTAYENEYACRVRLAQYFGCELDRFIYRRLATAGNNGAVVLAITTYHRWKSWALANFVRIVKAFPGKQFVLVGSTKEIPASETLDWEILRGLPNIQNLLDQLDLPGLARTIAEATAFVGSDSGGTHLANAFEKPGAVIFGPTLSETWHGESRLRLFHDQSCPYHPCTVLKCERPQNWCMNNTAAEAVIAHLQTLP